MAIEKRIFLENAVAIAEGPSFGHLYLVLREVEVEGIGNIVSNVFDATDKVIRGGIDGSTSGPLEAFAGDLQDSEGDYDDQPEYLVADQHREYAQSSRAY